MSADYGPLAPLRMADVFGGALEKYGVREEAVPEYTKPTARCLVDGENYLWVYGCATAEEMNEAAITIRARKRTPSLMRSSHQTGHPAARSVGRVASKVITL